MGGISDGCPRKRNIWSVAEKKIVRWNLHHAPQMITIHPIILLIKEDCPLIADDFFLNGSPINFSEDMVCVDMCVSGRYVIFSSEVSKKCSRNWVLKDSGQIDGYLLTIKTIRQEWQIKEWHFSVLDFFRRVTKDPDKFMKCVHKTSPGTCAITKETRSHCRYCRLQKCILAGMKPTSGTFFHIHHKLCIFLAFSETNMWSMSEKNICAHTGLEIAIKIWVSVRKTYLSSWISPAIYGFPVRKPKFKVIQIAWTLMRLFPGQPHIWHIYISGCLWVP